MKKRLLAVFMVLSSLSVHADVWTPYVSISRFKSYTHSDNFYVLSATTLSVPGCSDAQWLYFRIDEKNGQTASRLKQAKVVALAAQMSDKKIRAYGDCFNASTFEVHSFDIM